MSTSADEPASPKSAMRFGASYWKQQLLEAKDKLKATLTVHGRELQTIQRHRRCDTSMRLPTATALEDARSLILRRLIAPSPALQDELWVESPLHSTTADSVVDDLSRFLVDRRDRFRTHRANVLSRLSQTHRVMSELVAALDAETSSIQADEAATTLALARLNDAKTADVDDLSQYLSFLEAQLRHTKLTTRFTTHLSWLAESHRPSLLRRMHAMLQPNGSASPRPENDDAGSRTDAPPIFLLSAQAVEVAIHSFLRKLGYHDDRPELESDDDFLHAVRQLFPVHFASHWTPFVDDTSCVTRVRTTWSLGSLFPIASDWARHEGGTCPPDMLLDAEVHFALVQNVARVMERLETLATTHLKRAHVTLVDADIDPPPSDAKLKSYYLLRHLYLRQTKHRVLELLNVATSIERHLCLDAASTGRDAYDVIAEPHLVARTPGGGLLLYDAAWENAIALDRHLVALGSRYVRDTEQQSRTAPIVDRGSTLVDLYDAAMYFLEANIRLGYHVFTRLYLRVTSPVAQAKLRQTLVTWIHTTPLVDRDASYFWDAYSFQVVVLDVQRQLLVDMEARLAVALAVEAMTFSPLEAMVDVVQALQAALVAVETRMPASRVLHKLALDRAVVEHAVVLWHRVLDEDHGYTNASSSFWTTSRYVQYYTNDATSSIVAEAARDLSRQSGGDTGIMVKHLGRAVQFVQLQMDLSRLVYASAHVDAISRRSLAPFALAPPPATESYLDHPAAVEALDFTSWPRLRCILDWVQVQINGDAPLAWLAATVVTQRAELAFQSACLCFNRLVMDPIDDFDVTYEALFEAHKTEQLRNVELESNHRSFLMHLDSAVGRRLLAEKVRARVNDERHTLRPLLLQPETKRSCIIAELNAAYAIKVDTMHASESLETLMHDMLKLYNAQLLDDVASETCLTQLCHVIANLDVIGRRVQAPSVNPFVPPPTAPLERWFLDELVPLEDKLSKPTETLFETKWVPGDLTHFLHLPRAQRILQYFQATETASLVRPTLSMYLRFQDILHCLCFRAALHRQAVDDVFGTEVRDLVHQLQHQCAPAEPLAVVLDWLHAKRETSATCVWLTLQALLRDPSVLPPLQQEGAWVVSTYGKRGAMHGVTLLRALPDAVVQNARVLFKRLEARCVENSAGKSYLHKFEAFLGLRAFYFAQPTSESGEVGLWRVLTSEMAAGDVPKKQLSRQQLDLDVPEARILDQYMDNLRNYIELCLVNADMTQCTAMFHQLVASPSPSRETGHANTAFVANVMRDMAAPNADVHAILTRFCDTVHAASQREADSRLQSVEHINTQLRHAVRVLETSQADLVAKLARAAHETEHDRTTAAVDKSYAIVLDLERARHELGRVAHEGDVQRAKVTASVRAEYEAKLRELSSAVIAKHAKFDEYRASVQADLRQQIHAQQKTSIESFIASGAVPMQVKSQLVRAVRANEEIDIIMDENTNLKHALVKVRALYELREASLVAGHEKALGLVHAQLAKAKLAQHEKTRLEAQLEASRTEILSLRKQLAVATLPGYATRASVSSTTEPPEATTTTTAPAFSALSSFTQRLRTRRSTDVSANVGHVESPTKDPTPPTKDDGTNNDIDDDDDDESSTGVSDADGPAIDELVPRAKEENVLAMRAHYERATHHMQMEIRRLQAQVKAEMRLKASALDQLTHARAHAQELVQTELQRLSDEAVAANAKHADAVRELMALQELTAPTPEPFRHTRVNASRPKSSMARAFQSPMKPMARPQTSGYARPGPSARPLRGNQATVEAVMDARPKSAYSTKVKEVIQQEIEGVNQALMPRLRPLYR
ncbi:hypothetical protein SPRG_10466 [Saprolegnia parasitica CBS 223.65]|uniref:Uncharacterized protein n=1 Tax=Saprolegnia parasitica (strain CBS 223.65) TaxID=695850 RepID=A0A067C0R9_SAPPC|nr:hypothetical protein SPRG_10466 [Saprolegnia parasitica CBS 223.65]KDO24389.1 hypothetical protein SPRG_10466 [Saprolegnia parasitica CBS 223.65]|eukprot:XP_012204981.1 hypothetical protein SPRG_10466 [Saprolegnia parasitica CBS 223.65]